MTIEQLQQGNALQAQITQVQAKLNQVDEMLDDVKEPKVKTRVRGLEFTLPKAIFRGELQKEKTSLETTLSDLQAQFDTL